MKTLLERMEENIRAARPDWWSKLYPRHYTSFGNYHSPRNVATSLAASMLELIYSGSILKAPTASRLIYPGLHGLIQRRMPMFFLAPDFLQAILRTDFDHDIDWTTLKLPYESGILVLPRGAMVHPTDGEVQYIYYTRDKAGINPGPLGLPPVEFADDGFSFVAMCAVEGDVIWFDAHFTKSHRATVRFHNLFYRAPGEPMPTFQLVEKNLTWASRQSEVVPDAVVVEKNLTGWESDLATSEADFLERLGVILFGTLLAMNARPNLITREKFTHAVKDKRGVRREWWSPNIIGEHYRSPKQSPGTGTHASPRLHWRRGHFRNQPFGPGRSERKQIWLEPVMVGVETE